MDVAGQKEDGSQVDETGNAPFLRRGSHELKEQNRANLESGLSHYIAAAPTDATSELVNIHHNHPISHRRRLSDGPNIVTTAEWNQMINGSEQDNDETESNMSDVISKHWANARRRSIVISEDQSSTTTTSHYRSNSGSSLNSIANTDELNDILNGADLGPQLPEDAMENENGRGL